MRRFLLIGVLAGCFVVAGCEDEPEPVAAVNPRVVMLQAQLDTLRGTNWQLEEEIRLRNDFLKEYTRLINRTLADLERIAEHEGVFREIRVDVEAQEAGSQSESTQTIERRINENLRAIERFIEEGKERQAQLTRLAHKQADELDGLKDTIDRLNALVEMKEQSIQDLRTEARVLLDRIDRLKTQNAQLAEENTELREAYYVVDTPDELANKGIVEHRRGFLRLKRKTHIDKLDAQHFHVADVDTREIALGPASRYRILSDHRQNENLFSFQERGEDIYLAIADADAFWGISRYLVIEVKR